MAGHVSGRRADLAHALPDEARRPRSRRAVGILLWTKSSSPDCPLLCVKRSASPNTPPSPAWGLASDATHHLRFAPPGTSATRVLLVYAVTHDLGRALLRLAGSPPRRACLAVACLGRSGRIAPWTPTRRRLGCLRLSAQRRGRSVLGQTSRRVYRRNACLVLIYGCARPKCVNRYAIWSPSLGSRELVGR